LGPFVETFESRKYAIASRRKEKKYTVVVFGELPFTRLYGQDVSHLESSTHGEEVPGSGCDCAQQHKSIEASSARLAARAAAARLPLATGPLLDLCGVGTQRKPGVGARLCSAAQRNRIEASSARLAPRVGRSASSPATRPLPDFLRKLPPTRTACPFDCASPEYIKR